jgi:hypothetical protein
VASKLASHLKGKTEAEDLGEWNVEEQSGVGKSIMRNLIKENFPGLYSSQNIADVNNSKALR